MSKREIPTPFYAAAGAGDLAYQRLRRLPEAATRTARAAGDAASALRGRVAAGDSRLDRERLSSDVVRLRDSAQRRAQVFVANAAVAQEKAVTGYQRLVAHGERIMATRSGAHQAGTDPAEIPVAPSEAGPSEAAPGERPTS